MRSIARKALPCKALTVLLAIVFLDLVATAWLHSLGLIVELNPLMRPIIEFNEWAFVLVKGGITLAAWGAMAWYAQYNRRFVRDVALFGGVIYVAVWLTWFVSSSFLA